MSQRAVGVRVKSTDMSSERGLIRRPWRGVIAGGVLTALILLVALFLATPLHSVVLGGPLQVSTQVYSGPSSEVAVEGPLNGVVEGDRACFSITTDDGHALAITWPQGWSARDAEGLEIVDDWGNTYARVGDRVTLLKAWTYAAPASDC